MPDALQFCPLADSRSGSQKHGRGKSWQGQPESQYKRLACLAESLANFVAYLLALPRITSLLVVLRLPGGQVEDAT